MHVSYSLENANVLKHKTTPKNDKFYRNTVQLIQMMIENGGGSRRQRRSRTQRQPGNSQLKKTTTSTCGIYSTCSISTNQEWASSWSLPLPLLSQSQFSVQAKAEAEASGTGEWVREWGRGGGGAVTSDPLSFSVCGLDPFQMDCEWLIGTRPLSCHRGGRG